jgi:hypothetical protein
MNIKQEGHADKLEYGWWKPKHGTITLPRTLSHKNNYVLSHEELCVYEMTLIDMKRDIEAEQARVTATILALRRDFVRSYNPDPVCFSLAHIMQFMVKQAKGKLAIMQLLLYTTKRFLDEKKS